MAEDQTSFGFLGDEKDLEEGEIDDLEEGEIYEDFRGVSGYRFSASEEKLVVENGLQTVANNQRKSKSSIQNQRNSSRNSKCSRDRNERRTETYSSRTYEKANRNWAGGKQNFVSRRRDDSSRDDVIKHRSREAGQEFDMYSKEFDKNYLNRDSREISPDRSYKDVKYESEDEDFKSLLEQYKHIQEQLDELGTGSRRRSLVNEIIDDSFVDVPLDDVRNLDKPQDNLDAEIRKLEMDFCQTNLINPQPTDLVRSSFSANVPVIPQSIPTTYGKDEQNYPSEELFFGCFEPFQIKASEKKVRTLKELSNIDSASRGLVVENDASKVVNNNNCKTKGKNKTRRRPNKNVRQRMKRKAALKNQARSKVTSNNVYDELGVGVTKTQPENNGTIIISKQKLKEWQKLQSNGRDDRMTSLGDDYKHTPMEVESDSTESVGNIVESHPPLPPIDPSQPPPPGEEIQTFSTSHITPLMDVKPYGYFHDYGSPWWGDPEIATAQLSFTEEPAHEAISTSHRDAEMSKNNSIETPEEDSVTGSQNDLEVEDEASELALREQLLKSMVTKRAAKNAGKVNEKSATSSVASPSNSRAASPFMEPVSRKEIQETTRSEATKPVLSSAKVKIAPPKHDPVVIYLGDDSEDSESDDESPVKQISFFGGLDSFIKEARERSTKSKNEVKNSTDEQDGVQPPTPTTPEVVSVLSEEKREEYKKLKLQLALKEQRKGQAVSRKENASEGSMATKKNDHGAEKQAQEGENKTWSRQVSIKTTTEQGRHQEQYKKGEQLKEKQKRQKQVETNEPAQAVSLSRQSASSSSSNEIKRELKSLNEELLGHKRLIMQDQKLLESCENQLESSSKALGEHQNRVSLLKQQLQRAERLMKVQDDLVEKLKIQNGKLKQRKSIRESNARVVEARLLRTRALLGAKKSQITTSPSIGENPHPRIKPMVTNPGYQNPMVSTTGEKPPCEVRTAISNPGQDTQDRRVIIGQSNRQPLSGEKPQFEVKPTMLNPGQDTQDKRVVIGQSNMKPLTSEKPAAEVKPTILHPGKDAHDKRIISVGQSHRKPLSEVPKRIQEMTRIVEESVSPKKVKTSTSINNENGSVNLSNRNVPVEDRRIVERKRLQILEQKLSQKLRQSTARRQVGKQSESPRGFSLQHGEERSSSDGESTMKRNSCPRELTSHVESGKTSDIDEVDGGLRTQLFMDNNKLERVTRIQAEQEAKGPNFTRLNVEVALPIQFSSTRCAWLGSEDLNVARHLDKISGCLSAKPLGNRNETTKQTQMNRRATGPYRSPLVHFRSYRFSPYFRTKKGFTLDSPSFTHLINPRIPFCPFALQGICSDPECPYQHPDDVIPKDTQILQDLAAYFAPASKKASGDEDANDDVIRSITRAIDSFAKQYGDKVSPAELRVLFVNHLRKQRKSAGIFNIVFEQRAWRPISPAKKGPGTSSPGGEYPVETEKTFSWKSWRRKIENEIKVRSAALDECQEIRYFSENYDSVKTLEKATQENPGDESLWIRLAMVHVGSSRTEGDKNNNGRKNVDKALNTLAQALEHNSQSEKLWLKYLDVFRQRASVDELYEVCEEAVELAGSYNVWWAYLEIASDYERKANICLKCMQFLILSDTDKELKSHRLLDIFLYLIQLNLACDFQKLALTRFQMALNIAKCPRDASDILASLAENTTCEDLCLLWLSYIHLVEFSCLPRGFYDPARTGPARIVRKDGVVFPWKPGGGTRLGFTELFRLFSRALKVCTDASNSPDKVSPVFSLYKNLIALERASDKDESAIRTCRRLLKASPKKVELRLCMAALQQVSGHAAGVVTVYKEALEACNKHAQVAYSAAKYFIETNNSEECHEALRTCVYSKFVLEVPSPGPTTRSRSHDQPVLLQPDAQLLYKKLLAQTLPLDSVVPASKPGVRPGNLGSEGTYIWLCYCLFIELFSTNEAADRHSLTQTAYETAVYSTRNRHEVKTLWIEYLYYMARRLKDNLCTSEELHDIFHKCLTTVPVVTPVLSVSSKSWSDYGFHNEVLTLYRRCLGYDFSSSVYDKYLEMFPDNCQLAIQAVEHAYSNNEINKTRKILSSMLLKTPYCLDLWKIAISIELKERNFDQARQLYEHATEAVPLTASLWKDFAMFELAHNTKDSERVLSIVSKAKAQGITIEDFLKDISSKVT